MADLMGFEFLSIMGEGFRRRLVLPRLLADDLHGLPLQDVELRESSGDQPIWDVRMRINGAGRMFLDLGWPKFADLYQLSSGLILKFRNRGNGQFAVKVFDETMCRRTYYPYFPGDAESEDTSA